MTTQTTKKRFTARRFFPVLTVLVLLLTLGFNLWFTGFAAERAYYIDTTAEELYTFSPAMTRSCDTIFSREDAPEVTLTFCTDPDVLMASTQTRAVYIMALKLQKQYPGVTVKTVNIAENPTAVAAYKTTSMTEINAGHIIFSTPDSYRVTTAASFWMTKDSVLYSFQGEYRMVTMLLSLLAVDRPTAYFITGHGETVYDPEDPTSALSAAAGSFFDLLTDTGLKVRTLDLSAVDAVPEDCVLLILNNPTSDFTYDEDRLSDMTYVSDLEKIDRYLVERQGSLMVAKDYRRSLPTLEGYLKEWGFLFTDAQMKDDENSLADVGDTKTVLVAEYEADGTYSYEILKEYTALATAARTAIGNTSYLRCSYGSDDLISEDGSVQVTRNYAPFLRSYATAKSYTDDDGDGIYDELNSQAGVHTLAATTARIRTDSTTGDKTYSYVFCAPSPDFFSNDMLGNASYANRDVLALLVRNISRVDEYASMSLGGTSANSDSMYGKILLDSAISTATDDVYLFYLSENTRNTESITRTDLIDTLASSGDKTLEEFLREERAAGTYAGVLHGMTGAVRGWIIAAEVAVPVAILALGVYVCLKRRFL